jgi:epoxyqueuosine reductase
MPTSISDLKGQILARATALGFADARFTHAQAPPEWRTRLSEFIALERHASMDWLERRVDERADPCVLWPQARSALMLAMVYDGPADFAAELKLASQGVIASYARGRDYHDVIKGKLKTLAGFIAARSGQAVKVFVDTAPVMEKPLAARAGLGWQGKHSNLVSRDHGSWFFIGCILTEAEFAPDLAEVDHCGSCRACLDACPTKAFPAPYQLDARRCISYLTIEHEGHIAREFRHAMGNRIYGCDDCLAVCPWNKFAQEAAERKLKHRADLDAPMLAELLGLDDAAFRLRFSASPVKRTGRDRFIRNVLIAAGNSGDMRLADAIRPLLIDVSPLVRAMAVWALAQLGPVDELKLQHYASETDAAVRAEWESA